MMKTFRNKRPNIIKISTFLIIGIIYINDSKAQSIINYESDVEILKRGVTTENKTYKSINVDITELLHKGILVNYEHAIFPRINFDVGGGLLLPNYSYRLRQGSIGYEITDSYANDRLGYQGYIAFVFESKKRTGFYTTIGTKYRQFDDLSSLDFYGNYSYRLNLNEKLFLSVGGEISLRMLNSDNYNDENTDDGFSVHQQVIGITFKIGLIL